MNLTANHQLVDDWEDVCPSVENLAARDELQDPPTVLELLKMTPPEPTSLPPRVC